MKIREESGKIREESGMHVGIIMDGNGRWATRRGLSRIAGHRAGVAAVRRTVESAPELGVRVLTIYAFSSDNWGRPVQEVQSIFWIIRAFLRLECERLRTNGVRLEVIGRRDRIPRALLREIEHAEMATAIERRLHLRIAIDYSARTSIAEAAVVQCQAEEIDAERMRMIITQKLAGSCGDVDLLIRTGGEKRLSDYLLWESAYAELFFTDRMWPEFDGSDLATAVNEFRQRERRFGAVPALVCSDAKVQAAS
jgi:undecaprenyl diphosphate synthase